MPWKSEGIATEGNFSYHHNLLYLKCPEKVKGLQRRILPHRYAFRLSWNALKKWRDCNKQSFHFLPPVSDLLEMPWKSEGIATYAGLSWFWTGLEMPWKSEGIATGRQLRIFLSSSFLKCPEKVKGLQLLPDIVGGGLRSLLKCPEKVKGLQRSPPSRFSNSYLLKCPEKVKGLQLLLL